MAGVKTGSVEGYIGENLGKSDSRNKPMTRSGIRLLRRINTFIKLKQQIKNAPAMIDRVKTPVAARS
jgi:hypothetical protein